MGLDQYLHANLFTARKREIGGKEADLFHGEIYETVMTATDARPWAPADATAQIQIKIGYWRKANQIHKWFVDNCQDGNDDCRDAYVSREQLAELRDLCEEVLADHDKAEELLPTGAGFFFGSTDYDEWYFSDLSDTVEIINRALSDVPEEWSFTYGSSW